MKQILTLLLALLALIPAFGQSVAIRSLGGFGTNLTAKGLSVSNVVAFDRYRWVTITNGQITFSGWNADVIGTVPGLYFKGTNGLVQGQIDVNSDHQTGQLAELRILTDYDGAIGWGYNREFQLGISGGQYNQKLKLQYADQIGNSHLFVFRARTNGQNAGFALNGFHSDQTSPSVDLDLYDVEPTWNTFPTAGFSNPGHKIMKISTNGTWVTSTFRSDGGFIGNGARITNVFGFNTNTAGAGMISNSMPVVTFNGAVKVAGTLEAGSLTTTLGGSVTIFDHTSFSGAAAGTTIWDAVGVGGTGVFGSQFQPNDVQQPTNIMFRVDYPTRQKYGLGSFATNYLANANTAGYTNSRVAPGIGGTNNMVARVVGTSGTLEFYNRSGEYGATVCGVGVFTNTISSSTWHIPIPVNSGFIIRSGSGVDIQVYAQ